MAKELSEQSKKILEIFNCEDPRELSIHIRESLNNFDVYDRYLEAFPIYGEDQTDYVQRAYEEWQSAKKGLGQCYTPACIADTLAAVMEPEGSTPLLDICSGSGALVLGAWRKNPEQFFICQEYDTTVIPYLLFNLAIRNANALVIQSDALRYEPLSDPWNEKYWLIIPGEKYATILERKDMTREKMMEILDGVFEKVANDPSMDNLRQAHVMTELANSIETLKTHQENDKACDWMMDFMSNDKAKRAKS